jgi:hypothetical protein
LEFIVGGSHCVGDRRIFARSQPVRSEMLSYLYSDSCHGVLVSCGGAALSGRVTDSSDKVTRWADWLCFRMWGGQRLGSHWPIHGSSQDDLGSR